MANGDKIEMEGVVVDAMRGSMFKVKLNENDLVLQCTLSGKLRQNYIRVLVGDSVTVSISPYDLTKGIITWRNK